MEIKSDFNLGQRKSPSNVKHILRFLLLINNSIAKRASALVIAFPKHDFGWNEISDSVN